MKTNENINRQVLKNFTKNLNHKAKRHFLKAVIVFNKIYLEKRIDLIDTFKHLADVGHSGQFNGLLNKDCNIILLKCTQDILMLEFAGLHRIKNIKNLTQ